MQQNMRSAMYFLERDIKMAGYDGDKNSPPSATIVTAEQDLFSFQYVDDTNTQVTITYSLYDAIGDGDMDIGRSVDNNSRAAIAENIEDVEFFYTLSDGRQAVDPLTDLAAPVNLADIRTVGISILARSANETFSMDGSVFTSLSGAVVGPFSDNFKRQMIVATIKCRNMI